ncbi:MAG: RNA-binding protein [Armatimonadetes bacterium]|nr:RNA-binding protein [Armatimonadota bacterium]
MNIYVGNLPYNMEEQDLQEAFEAFGDVVSATIIRDRDTGRHRGFGFVEMSDEESGESAITGLDGTEIMGRRIVVNKAKPKARGGAGRGR